SRIQVIDVVRIKSEGLSESVALQLRAYQDRSLGTRKNVKAVGSIKPQQNWNVYIIKNRTGINGIVCLRSLYRIISSRFDGEAISNKHIPVDPGVKTGPVGIIIIRCVISAPIEEVDTAPNSKRSNLLTGGRPYLRIGTYRKYHYRCNCKKHFFHRT